MQGNSLGLREMGIRYRKLDVVYKDTTENY